MKKESEIREAYRAQQERMDAVLKKVETIEDPLERLEYITRILEKGGSLKSDTRAALQRAGGRANRQASFIRGLNYQVLNKLKVEVNYLPVSMETIPALERAAHVLSNSGEQSEAQKIYGRLFHYAESQLERPNGSQVNTRSQYLRAREYASGAGLTEEAKRLEGLMHSSHGDRIEHFRGKRDKERTRRLEALDANWKKILARYFPETVVVIGFFGDFFFLSPRATGNVIGLQQTSAHWIGGALIIVGLVGALLVSRKKNTVKRNK